MEIRKRTAKPVGFDITPTGEVRSRVRVTNWGEERSISWDPHQQASLAEAEAMHEALGRAIELAKEMG